jgi:hypothetical protein
MKIYYTYAYLRPDGTPYYVGKGCKDRAFSIVSHRKNGIHVPTDSKRIVFLKTGLTDEEALLHERYMIFILGRKDLGTGILRNRTNGGDGAAGAVRSEEFKENRTGQKNGNSKTNRAIRGVKKLKTINDGKRHRRIPVDSKVPEGWTEGVTESYKEAISKGHHNVEGENNPVYGKRRITDGKRERRIPKDQPIPEGWWEGAKNSKASRDLVTP